MISRSLALGLLFISASAFAGVPSDNNGGLDGAKAKCNEFKNNKQMNMQHAHIICDEISYYWKPLDSQTRTLPNTRAVGGAIAFDLKDIAFSRQVFSQPAADTAYSCQRLVKVERKIGNIDQTLSCDELLAIDDLSSFCNKAIGERGKMDPGLVTETQTSDVLDFCPQGKQAPIPQKGAELPTPQKGVASYSVCTANNGQGYGDHWFQDGVQLGKNTPDFSDASTCIVASH